MRPFSKNILLLAAVLTTTLTLVTPTNSALAAVPVLSSVAATSDSSTAAIMWNTDIPATSQVQYGTTTPYSAITLLNPVCSTTHSVLLQGLTSGTMYHFNALSTDACMNVGNSGDDTFMTTTPTNRSADVDSTPPLISSVASSTATSTATISWTTDELSDSQVAFGTTTAYGVASSSPVQTTAHTLLISGLQPATSYHFRVQSSDSSGNVASSSDFMFATGVTASTSPTSLLMTNRLNLMGFGGFTGSATDTDSNTRLAINNQTGTGVTKFKLYYAGWMANATNEQDGYNPVTISAAIEYPAGTFTPVTFSGATSTVLAVSQTLETDEVSLSIPSGAEFWVRTYVSVSAGQRWVQGYIINAARGEAADFSTGVNKTVGGTIINVTPTATHRGFGPIAIKATGFTGTPVKRAFASVGDSILMQAGDGNFDAKGSGGWNGRALTDVYPHVNFAISGTAASMNLPANFTRRLTALKMVGVTDILDDFSNNDLGGGRTYAQVTGDITTIVNNLETNGFRVHYATPLPYTTSTDGWKTTTNQTIYTTRGDYVGTTTSIRAQVANFIRANTIGLAGVVDIADGVDVNSADVLTRNGGYWIAGNAPSSSPSVYLTSTGATTDAATGDGRHPNVTKTSTPIKGGHFILRDIFAAYLAALPAL